MEFNIKSNKEIQHDSHYLSRNEPKDNSIKLIGYSSDDLPISAMRFGKLVKSKKQRREERKPLEFDEWFVYLNDNEKVYFKTNQDIPYLKTLHKEVKFLGIGRPNQPIHRPAFPTKYITENLKEAVFGTEPKSFDKKIIPNQYMGLCCYCETPLNKGINYTKEHIVPINRGGKGGKNIKPCCYSCNQEKGGLMLHSYIQMLNLQMLDVKGDELIKLQTKIKNANILAKDLENNI